MFDLISKNFSEIFGSVFSKNITLTKSGIEPIIKRIESALLESDVSHDVASKFVSEIEVEILGTKIEKNTKPQDFITSIVLKKITTFLGEGKKELLYNEDKKPNVVMFVGLQGAGKTTTVAKVAKLVKSKFGRNILMSSLDIYRPAAMEQLEILAKNNSIKSVEIQKNQTALQIAKRSLEQAKDQNSDYLFLDTAGRTQINEELMNELIEIKNVTNPSEIILVVDSLIGRGSSEVIKGFDQKLGLTSVILTRLDGDSRGGVALNIKELTGISISYVGTGEKIDDIDEFIPDRIANRMMGFGDIDTIAEKATSHITEIDQKKIEAKIKKGEMDFNDLLVQLEAVTKMGGIEKVLSFLPMGGKIKEAMNSVDKNELQKQIAIIRSMTKKERQNPMLVSNIASRRKRIANGSGVQLIDINKMSKRLEEMKKVTKKFANANKSEMIKNFSQNMNLDDIKKMF